MFIWNFLMITSIIVNILVGLLLHHRYDRLFYVWQQYITDISQSAAYFKKAVINILIIAIARASQLCIPFQAWF